MTSSFSRRDFLKLSALSMGGLLLPRHLTVARVESLMGRVAYQSVSVFDAPLFNANTLGYRFRDDLLDIQYSLHPLRGPAYNPLWYRIDDGYVHSAQIQPVSFQYNEVLPALPENGQLCRVTVPYTQAYNYSSQAGWTEESKFMLYYQSNHWVTAIVDGPNGNPWYQITESWEGTQYYAEAAHLQMIPDDELTPIAPEANAEKRVEISLSQQLLTAYQGDQVVLRTPISSGVNDTGAPGPSTETPTGTFNIQSKLPAKYMGDNRLTDTLSDHFLTGVPWTCFFHADGYAIHGAYWHNNFGWPMSRGCVNVRPAEAQWLYRWMTPAAEASDWEVRGNGTRVTIS